jgi:hypothetical protein
MTVRHVHVKISNGTIFVLARDRDADADAGAVRGCVFHGGDVEHRAIEAESLEGVAEELRRRYPDERFERVLRSERDLEAESRRAEAHSGLIDILVDAMVRDVQSKGSLALE